MSQADEGLGMKVNPPRKFGQPTRQRTTKVVASEVNSLRLYRWCYPWARY